MARFTATQKRCDTCGHSRLVPRGDGYYDCICGLSEKEKLDCFMGKTDRYDCVGCQVADANTESDNSIVGTKWNFEEKISYEQPDLSDVKFIDEESEN